MIRGRSVLAVVPARRGSKGVPHKNLAELMGLSLIGHAGRVLRDVPFVDRRIISTDSEAYREEGLRHGLEGPFLRPAELSGDEAGAVPTMQHALVEAERQYGQRFDIVLIIEPTSPLRAAQDIMDAVHLLLGSGADSVVTVSRTIEKYHPLKALKLADGRLDYFMPEAARVVGRQQVSEHLYHRNGVCYALTRECLMEKEVIISVHTRALVLDRPLVNIDEPIELAWAEFLMQRSHRVLPTQS